MKIIKEFLKPDLRRICIVLVFLLLLVSISLFLLGNLFFNMMFSDLISFVSSNKAFILCTNTTQNVTEVRECYGNEIKKSEHLSSRISREREKYESYAMSIFIIYPGISRLGEPISNCLFINYEKYNSEFKNLFNSSLIEGFIRAKKSSCAFYQIIFELILMLLYFYLISCLIVWVYDKVKKR